MKKLIGVFSLFLILTSCSSVQVVDYWKKKDLEGIDEGKTLVIAPLSDEIARLRFENAIFQGLKDKGIDAYTAISMYPGNKPKDSISKEQINKFRSQLESDGIEIVVMTVLKEKQEYASTQYTGDNYGFYGPRMYGGYYGGFYGYYGSFYMGGVSSYSSSVTTVNKKYILETVVYDLRTSEKDQMLGAVTLSVDNPTTLGSSAEVVSKKIVREDRKSVV